MNLVSFLIHHLVIIFSRLHAAGSQSYWLNEDISDIFHKQVKNYREELVFTPMDLLHRIVRKQGISNHPSSEDFKDGDLKSFLEDFEDLAEFSGMKTDGGKIAALRTLMKGRAKMALEAARRGPAKAVLLAEFDPPADRQEAMRQFKTAWLRISEDPLVYLVSLQKFLDRAMPDLDAVSSEKLVADRYVDGLTPGHSSHIRVARASGRSDMQALVRLARELICNGVAVNPVVSEKSTNWQMSTTTGVPMLFGEDRKIVTSADLSPPLMTRDTGSVSLPQSAEEPSELPTARQEEKSDNQVNQTADISTTISKPIKLETTQSTEQEFNDGEMIGSLTSRSLEYDSASLTSDGREKASDKEGENSRNETAKERHFCSTRTRVIDEATENHKRIRLNERHDVEHARNKEQNVAVTVLRTGTNDGYQSVRRYDPGGTRCKWKDPPWKNR